MIVSSFFFRFFLYKWEGVLDYYCNVFFNVVKYDFISEKECTVLAMYVSM